MDDHDPARRSRRHDLNSKLFDGLLPALVLYLLLMLILLGLAPIRAFFGGRGLFMYALGLLAVSMFSLQRALARGLSETSRAWYGLAAGVLAWALTGISGMIDGGTLTGVRGVILLILVGLVLALLWRTEFPLGARFFSLAFVANWGTSVFLAYLRQAAAWSPALTLLYRTTGVSAVILAGFILLWVVFRSQRRIQRMWASLAIVMLAAFAYYVFMGNSLPF